MAEKRMTAMQKKLYSIRLFDFYGNLLTENQQELMRQHYEEDLTLAEIAQTMGVSRQSVHDTLNRALLQLSVFEQKLALCQQFDQTQQKLEIVIKQLNTLHVQPDQANTMQTIIDSIQSILGEEA